jgi:uncharacterized protein YukE
MANPPSSLSDFRIELGKLHHAIGVVHREHGAISGELATIASEFRKCKDSWDTPSTVSFDAVQNWLSRAGEDLNSLLSEMAVRMQVAYDSYKTAEVVNAANVKPHGKGNPGSGDHRAGKVLRVATPKNGVGEEELSVGASHHGTGEGHHGTGEMTLRVAQVIPGEKLLMEHMVIKGE